VLVLMGMANLSRGNSASSASPSLWEHPSSLQSSKTAWRKPPSKALPIYLTTSQSAGGMAPAPDGVPVFICDPWGTVTPRSWSRLSWTNWLMRQGKDPFEFRRGLLGKHPRHSACWNSLPKKPAGGKALSKRARTRFGRHESFGSYVAQVAEVSISKIGDCASHRVVCAAGLRPGW